MADLSRSALRPFQAILFDVDDTLFDRRTLFTQWAHHYIRDILTITDAPQTSKIMKDAADFDGNGYGSKKELIEFLLARHPPPIGSGYNVDTTYSEFFDQSALSPDAVALLNYLEASGIPYGIVTNGGPRQIEKVKKLGLNERTPCVFVSETFGSAKPDPAIFIAAAACLGILPKEILFVGDHPINDIQGARNAGMSTVWLSNGQDWPRHLKGLRPDVSINSMGQFMSVLIKSPAR